MRFAPIANVALVNAAEIPVLVNAIGLESALCVGASPIVLGNSSMLVLAHAVAVASRAVVCG